MTAKNCRHRAAAPSAATAALTLGLLGVCAGCHMAASGHNVAGVRMYQQGQYQQASERFQRAVAANPASADSYYNLASVKHAQAKTQGNDPELMREAENLYNKCLDLERDHVECHRALGVLLAERGEPERQFTLMKNWAASSPKLADPRIELARIYEEYGDSQTAMRHLEEAVMIDPNSARAWAALGSMQEKQGDLKQALQNYQRALALNRMQPGVSARVAALQQTLGAKKEAETAALWGNGIRPIAQPASYLSP